MPRLLMVPLDGSACAEQALPLALAIARRAGAALHLVQVRSALPLGETGAEQELYLANMAAQLQPELTARISHDVLTNEQRPLDFPPPAPESVADVLAHAALEENADLVVMTTHGRGGLRRAWLGSVADSLLRIAPRPVILLRPTDEQFGTAAAADRGLAHIVVPLDGSDSAEQAIPVAVQIGEPFGARYSLVRVVSPLTWQMAIDAYGAPPAMVPPTPLSRYAVAGYLEGVATSLRERGLTVSTHVLDGTSPAPQIVDFAKEHAADLIALSTAGAGGITRLLLGSVADKIVRSADVPVLLCNTRQAEPLTTRAASATLSAAPPV